METVLDEAGTGRPGSITPAVAGQDAAQVPVAKDGGMIETLVPDRANKALHERILPWALRRREDFRDAHALHAMPNGAP